MRLLEALGPQRALGAARAEVERSWRACRDSEIVQLCSFSPHTDYTVFTVLLQDSSGGLQARNAAGDWIEGPLRCLMKPAAYFKSVSRRGPVNPLPEREPIPPEECIQP